METRQLGNSDIHLAPLVFGGNVFGWTLDEAGSFRILDEFVDAGFNFINTADVYSRFVPGHVGGESETIIGRWLSKRGRRDDLVIMTKVGIEMPGRGKGLSAAWIKGAVEGWIPDPNQPNTKGRHISIKLYTAREGGERVDKIGIFDFTNPGDATTAPDI